MITKEIQVERFPKFTAWKVNAQSGADEGMSESSDVKVESSSFWDLVVPHKHKLYNFINKSLSYSSSADDIYQETLLRGLRYFKSFKKDMNISTWLFKIAHHEIKKHWKRQGRQIPLRYEERIAVKDETVDQVLVREIYQQANMLKPKHKEVFFLYYDVGFNISEIAKITGLKSGNIKFILNKTREAIRNFLGE